MLNGEFLMMNEKEREGEVMKRGEPGKGRRWTADV